MGLFDGLKNQSRKLKDQEGNAVESEQVGYNPENAPVIERDPNVSRETGIFYRRLLHGCNLPLHVLE